MTSTKGQAFFDRHMALIVKNDVDGLVDEQYTADAILISPFDLLGTPPPHVVRGNAALKDFFGKYLAWQGSIEVETLYDFVETDDSICFQAIFTSPNTGRWVVGDEWYMREGKIHRHFSFSHKLD